MSVRRYELQVAQGLRNFPVAFCWATTVTEHEKVGRPITTAEVAKHLGYPVPLTRALLRQAESMRMVKRSGPGARPGWLPGPLDPIETVETYRDLATTPPMPSPNIGPKPDGFAGLEPQEAPVTDHEKNQGREKRHRYQATMDPATWARLTAVAERTGQTLSRLLEGLAVEYLREFGPITWREADLVKYWVTVAAPDHDNIPGPGHDPQADRPA